MIFGVQAPRFIFNHRLPGEVTVDLDHAKVLDFEPQTDYVENVSKLDGAGEMYSRGTFWAVRILVHLYKFADPAAMYGTISTYKGMAVALYIHRDAAYSFLGNSTEDGFFVLKEIVPFFLTTTDYKDALILTFENARESTGATGPTPGRWAYVQRYDADGHPMYDANHKAIFVWKVV